MSHGRHILIFGGCGFMGSHFIRHLYQAYPDYRLTNVDLLTYAGNADNLSDIEQKERGLSVEEKRYAFQKGDICDQTFVNALFAKNTFDVVVNFAAESHVDRSILNAMQFVRTNIYGAYVLLEAARIHRVPRFIYISTDEVYGDIPAGVTSAEDYPFRPTNPYAASKASADLLAQSYMKTHKLPIVIIRSSNNYGSHQYPEKLHPLIITNLLEDRPIPVHGEGRHIRSWLHVADFCRAVDCIMHRAVEHAIYNIAGEEKSNLDVIAAVANVLGKDHRPYINYINDRPGPDYRYAADDTKLRHDLGWERQQTYDAALADLVHWYLDNTQWWLKVRSKSDFIDHYVLQSKGYELFGESVNPGKF